MIESSRETAAERTLYYRRVLAAWTYLIEVDHREALVELNSLIQLERAPLRRTPAARGVVEWRFVVSCTRRGCARNVGEAVPQSPASP